MLKNAQHSSNSAEWFTPTDIVESARRVLGTIDLDPASCAEANEVVRATYYYDGLVDGLSTSWLANVSRPFSVFLNPPSGRRDGKSLPRLFWERLHEYRTRGELKHAIFVAFSLEQLQSTQRPGVVPMLAFPVCFPAKRLRFRAPGGKKATSPTHSSAVVYVPGTVDESQRFVAEFSQFGRVKL